jgi:hypothetical protein
MERGRPPPPTAGAGATEVIKESLARYRSRVDHGRSANSPQHTLRYCSQNSPTLPSVLGPPGLTPTSPRHTPAGSLRPLDRALGRWGLDHSGSNLLEEGDHAGDCAGRPRDLGRQEPQGDPRTPRQLPWPPPVPCLVAALPALEHYFPAGAYNYASVRGVALLRGEAPPKTPALTNINKRVVQLTRDKRCVRTE